MRLYWPKKIEKWICPPLKSLNVKLCKVHKIRLQYIKGRGGGEQKGRGEEQNIKRQEGKGNRKGGRRGRGTKRGRGTEASGGHYDTAAYYSVLEVSKKHIGTRKVLYGYEFDIFTHNEKLLLSIIISFDNASYYSY